jgi:peptidyl-prolyl cis-trans isomerase SurA
MQRIIPWIAAGILLAAAPAGTADELVDGIAAQIGEDVVLLSDVMAAIGDVEQRMRAEGAPEIDIAKLRAMGLERMIEQKMVESEVRRMELYASDREVDDTIETIANDNGLSVSQLEANVRSEGLSFPEYREAIKNKIEYQKVVQISLLPKVQIEENEVRRLYDERYSDQPVGGEQVHLRQLMVPVREGVDANAACVEVRAAAQRIAGGEAFEAVASEVSVISPRQGGDIGWLHVGSLAPWMAELVAKLEPGGVSEVRQQSFGCNLLKLVERRAFERITYEKAEESLYLEIQNVKMDEAFVDWMNELRKHTYIKRRGYFANAAEFDDVTPNSGAPEAGQLFQ